jgi:hypothetical protein
MIILHTKTPGPLDLWVTLLYIYKYTKCDQYIAFKIEHLNEIKVADRSVNYSITFQKMDSQYIIFHCWHVKSQLPILQQISP